MNEFFVQEEDRLLLVEEIVKKYENEINKIQGEKIKLNV